MADRQVAAALMAAGAKDVKLPTLHEVRQDFDAALVAEPKRLSAVDAERAELHRLLGVA